MENQMIVGSYMKKKMTVGRELRDLNGKKMTLDHKWVKMTLDHELKALNGKEITLHYK